MASTNAKAIRRANALGRLSASLNIEAADLHYHAKGDPEMALVMTLERIADAVEAKEKTPALAKAKAAADAPLTVETVEIVEDAPKAKGKSK